MKKRFLLFGVILLCLVALCARAEDAAVEKVPVVLQNGDTIALSLNFSGEMAGMQAMVKWDPLCFALETIPEYSSDFQSGAMVAMLNPDMENGTLNLVYLRQQNAAFDGAQVLEMEFRALDNALPCMTEIFIVDCQAVDENAGAVETLCEGFAVQIGGPAPAESIEPSVSPEPSVAPAAARLYIDQILPEPSATPEAAFTPAPDITPEPEVTPTRTPVPTAKPPAGSSGGSVSSGVTPTPGPTVTPSPTVPSLILGSETPVPQSGRIYMKLRNIKGGFAIDLIADNVEIGGLQANIDYNASEAKLLSRKFSDAFLANSMIHMINDADPGRISLVYSNLNGYTGDGSAIFTAEFAAEKAAKLSLNNVKYTGTGENLSAITAADQNAAWEIQPEDDLEIVEEDSVKLLRVDEKYISLTLDPGECISLQFEDRLPQEVYWTSARGGIASVSPEGLVEAHGSGLVLLTALDAKDATPLAEVRVCVRNSAMGLPVEIVSVTFDDGFGDVFALTASEEIADGFALRGIRLYFVDEERRTIVEGLLPEEMDSIPEGAFELCGNLTEIEITGSNIIRIEENAFSACKELSSVTLSGAVAEIGLNAFPQVDFTLIAPEGSEAERYADENGVPYKAIEQAGDAG